MDTHQINKLNAAQQDAVFFTTGPSIILAGAGSGKTRVLVAKVLHLIEKKKAKPSEIVMITFTNKAAAEMKKRMNIQEDRPLGFVGTFHSFCAQLLRKYAPLIGYNNDFVIFDDDDTAAVLKIILKTYEEERFTVSYVAHLISSAKNQLITPDSFLTLFSHNKSDVIKHIYSQYQENLHKMNAFDFDDLIMKTVELLRQEKTVFQILQRRYKYVLIDEFQDTNAAQYILSHLLAGANKNITVVGDFSQSIYSWRGADMKNLEQFKIDFPSAQTFFLEENYRSTKQILLYANTVISKNKSHPVLGLHTKNRAGDEVTIQEVEDETDEARYVISEIERLSSRYQYKDMSILYRINAQSRIFEELLLQYSIPYMLIGGIRFYERKEIKDILSYLRLIINKNNHIAQERIIKLGKRKWMQFEQKLPSLQKKIANKSTEEIIEEVLKVSDYLSAYSQSNPEDYSRLENIRELKNVAHAYPQINAFLEQVSLVESEYFEKEQRRKGEEGVRLMTLHQVKGLEFPVVFIVGVEEGILPHARSSDDQFQIEEERRLFYVGLTRAQQSLYVTHARKRYLFGRSSYSSASRFIAEEDIEW